MVEPNEAIVQNNEEDLIKNEIGKEANQMIELWVLKIKLGWGKVEDVSTIYKMPVYITLVERGIKDITEIPVEYRERVMEELHPTL